MNRASQEGVFALLPDGRQERVHAWQGEDYGLADIPEYFGYGRWKGEALVLSADDLERLRIAAHAESFDHEPGLIELCLDLERFQKRRVMEALTLVERG